MRRKLSIIAASMSALLCIAVMALWVRSYVAFDFVYAVHDSGEVRGLRQIVGWRSGHGGMMISYIHSPNLRFPGGEPHFGHEIGPPGRYPWCYTSYPTRSLWHRLGFEADVGYFGISKPFDVWECQVVLPYWSLLLLLLVQPVLTLRAFRLGNRAAGCCLKCGYDLRASPDRCPECGTAKLRLRSSTAPAMPEGDLSE